MFSVIAIKSFNKIDRFMPVMVLYLSKTASFFRICLIPKLTKETIKEIRIDKKVLPM